MADPYDERDFDPDGTSFAQRRPRVRALVVLVSFAALGVMGIGGYIWLTYGHPIENGRYAPALDPEVATTLKELRALQLQSAAKMNAIDQSMVAIQVDLKRLSDQLSVLDRRMNALQNVWNPLSPEPDIGAQPMVPPGKKQFQMPKPAGPDSPGRAPPTAPAPDESDRQ